MSQSHGSTDSILFTVQSNYASPDTNQMRHAEALRRLAQEGATEGYDMHIVKVMDEGVQKVGYIVTEDYVDAVEELLDMYDQEGYILLVTHMHGMRKAIRMSLDVNEEGEFIGYMRSVPVEMAIRSRSYVHRPDKDAYFLVHPSDETNMAELAKLGFYTYN